ncbi:MAG: DHA2 family efflux MFS transporter permease subunit [Acetobacteraceae bacterium]
MSDARDVAWQPRGNVWLVAGAATLAPFMEILDTTIVNVSLPNIAGALSASNADATWTLTSYLVANGIVVPVAGWLGRLIGRKRYFLICIAMFTVCSFLCGIATSLPELVAFRLLQGLFGGGLQPAQQSVILDTFEPSQRARGFSLVAIAVIFAPIIGPTLGGWITDNYSWRWVFLINVPVGLFAFIAVSQLVEDPPWVQRDRAHVRDIDYGGLALIALGLGSLQIVLDRGEDSDWFNDPGIQLFALLAAVGIIGGIAWLLIVEKPVVNLRCLRDRNFGVGVVMVSGIGAILYSTNVIIPVMAQQWFGYTALLAGLLLSPGAAVMILFIPIVARLVLPNVQTRYVIAFGFFMLGCSAAYAHQLTPQMDFWTLASFRAFQTIGLAFLFVPNSTLSYSSLPRSLNADATALYSMFRNIFGSIGIAVITALGVERQQVHRAYLSEHLSPFDQPYQELLARHTQALQAMGHTASSAHDAAMGLINQTLNKQAAILSYMDLYEYTAVTAFCLVPLTLLFRAGIAGRGR